MQSKSCQTIDINWFNHNKLRWSLFLPQRTSPSPTAPHAHQQNTDPCSNKGQCLEMVSESTYWACPPWASSAACSIGRSHHSCSCLFCCGSSHIHHHSISLLCRHSSNILCFRIPLSEEQQGGAFLHDWRHRSQLHPPSQILHEDVQGWGAQLQTFHQLYILSQKCFSSIPIICCRSNKCYISGRVRSQ